jgi:sulfite oxidase
VDIRDGEAVVAAMTISRREFLLESVIGGFLLLKDLRSSALRIVPEHENCSLIPRWSKQIAMETPLPALSSWITPPECFYVFNHVDLIALDFQWSLLISGEVERPLKLALTDLSRFGQVDVTNTLECAGNGRTFFRPRSPGVQWERGAVSNAIFSGPRLREILEASRVRKTAKHIAFTGTDTLSSSKPRFIRSIPVEKAFDPDTILATRMNGNVLSLEHGFPIRALIPGWIGAASVKRLGEIRVLAHEAEGEFMQQAYRLASNIEESNRSQPASSIALTTLQVKSIIVHIANSQAGLAPVLVSGMAWAGESAISKVEVSTDSGSTWHPASLQRQNAKWAWTIWKYSWTPPQKGTFRISARATDSAGHIQPETPKWNPRGYLWNGIDHRQITIE